MWFEGNISDAIQTAKSNEAIFIVYIYGDDEMSQQMADVWKDAAVCKLCEDQKCVGLQLKSDSEACSQFGQIYPVVCVPCTFFIGNNGIPLEVVGGYTEPSTFLSKIEAACKLHRGNDTSGVANTRTDTTEAMPPAAKQARRNVEPAEPEHKPETLVQSPSENIPQRTPERTSEAGDSPQASDITEAAAGASGTAAPPPAVAQQPPLSADEKVKRAREIIDQKRLERMEKERQDVQKKEQERRQLGREMNSFQQMKSDLEAEELRQARLKEKREAREARERVRRQIAADKAERAARQQKEKDERMEAAAAAADPPTKAPVTQSDPSRMQSALLQFRLPSGQAITEKFSSSQPLAVARDYIAQHVASMGPFTMSTSYPKRTFTQEDMSETLLSLQLAPSAAILILPSTSRSSSWGNRGSQTASASGGSDNDTGFLAMLFFPIIALWRFLCNFLFGAPDNSATLPPASHPPTPAQADKSAAAAAAAAADPNPEPSTSSGRARPKSSYGLRRRQEGNIHRLTAEDEDEDRTTWNGNSTQQL